MTYLTKKETAYFIFIGMLSMAILIGTLFAWYKTQVNCWQEYTSKEQAIIKCEGE